MSFGFFLSSYLIRKFVPEAKDHGTEKAIEAINEKAGKMDIKAVSIKLISAFFTIITGGSIGNRPQQYISNTDIVSSKSPSVVFDTNCCEV